MKYLCSLLLFIALACNCLAGPDWLSAQNSRRNSSFPMYLSVGTGIQSLIGNEDESSARFNGIRPHIAVECGYSLTSELYLALNVNIFMLEGQTRYAKNPFVDRTGQTVGTDGYWPYTSFNLYGTTIMGELIIDWTDIIGKENFSQRKFHVLTPLGFGITVTTGKKENPVTTYSPFNMEFSFSTGVTCEYALNESMHLFITPRITMMHGTIDYSPYSDEETSRVDMIPSLTAGVRFRLANRFSFIRR